MSGWGIFKSITLFQQTGITELTTDLLLGCDDSDLKIEFGMTIIFVVILALGDFYHTDVAIISLHRAHHKQVIPGDILMKITQRSHYLRDTTRIGLELAIDPPPHPPRGILYTMIF